MPSSPSQSSCPTSTSPAGLTRRGRSSPTGRSRPYLVKSADLLLSNAVIDHVGDETDQRQFVGEPVRVGKHCIITTPNRWCQVESHMSAVFGHWSPTWRASRGEFTRLLSLREFRLLLPTGTRVTGRPWKVPN
jgi:hypothetical protein